MPRLERRNPIPSCGEISSIQQSNRSRSMLANREIGGLGASGLAATLSRSKYLSTVDRVAFMIFCKAGIDLLKE
ncbi:MAG: hypothetical protein ACKN89_16235 [Cyanobium sp.]|jgi:hypothetical protein